MKKELLDYCLNHLRWRMARHVGDRLNTVEGVVAWGKYRGHEIVADDYIKFRFGEYSWIHCKGLTPVKVTNEKFEEPVLMNKNVTDVSVDVISNTSNNDAKWSYTYTKEESTSDTFDVGASISVGIRQQIGYGGDLYGASGETELSLNVSASFNKSTNTSSSVAKEQSIEVTVPANKRCSISQEFSTAKYKQNLSCEAVFDFAIGVEWKNQWMYWFDDLDDLQDCIDGSAVKNQHNKKNQFIGVWELKENAIESIQDRGVLVKQTKRFDKATSGDVKITEA